MFEHWSTATRPKISLSGAMKSGPPAYARTKMDVVIARTTSLLMPKCAATWLDAGAIMEEEIGDRKVKDDMTTVVANFFRNVQLGDGH